MPWLPRARCHVEHGQVLAPVLVQIPPLDQLRPNDGINRDARRRREVERVEQVARSNEGEVVFGRRRPGIRAVQLTVFVQVAADALGNEWLPSL